MIIKNRIFELLVSVVLISLQEVPNEPGKWPYFASKVYDNQYVDLSDATGGYIYTKEGSDLEKIAFILPISDTVFITRIRGTLENKTCREVLPVDSTVRNLIFKVNRDQKGKVRVLDPFGNPISSQDPGVKVAELSHLTIYLIEKPLVGDWALELEGNGWFFVSVEAQSSIDPYEFEFVQLKNSVHTGYFPMEKNPPYGTRTHVKATMFPHGAYSGLQFELRSMDGKVVRPAEIAPGDGEYASKDDWIGEIVVPPGPFRVYVKGKDEKGKPFLRVFKNLYDTGPLQLPQGKEWVIDESAVEKIGETPLDSYQDFNNLAQEGKRRIYFPYFDRQNRLLLNEEIVDINAPGICDGPFDKPAKGSRGWTIWLSPRVDFQICLAEDSSEELFLLAVYGPGGEILRRHALGNASLVGASESGILLYDPEEKSLERYDPRSGEAFKFQKDAAPLRFPEVSAAVEDREGKILYTVKSTIVRWNLENGKSETLAPLPVIQEAPVSVDRCRLTTDRHYLIFTLFTESKDSWQGFAVFDLEKKTFIALENTRFGYMRNLTVGRDGHFGIYSLGMDKHVLEHYRIAK